jgi:putative ABC transport system permease protein
MNASRAPAFVALVWRGLFLRPLRRRPWRFAITVLGVAVGVASVLATVAANRAAVASLREGVGALAGRARVELTRPGGVPQDLLGSLRPVCDRAVVVPIVEELVLSRKLYDSVRILGVDLLLDSEVRDLEFVAAAPDPAVLERLLRGEGVVLPDSLAQKLGTAVGDSLELFIRSKPRSFVVLAIVKPARFPEAWSRTVIADVAAAQEWFGKQGRLDRIEVAPRMSEVQESLESLKATIRGLVPADVRVSEPERRGEESARMVRALEFNLTALSGISLLVGSVLVAITLATSVVQRRPILALLRSLGAGPRQIATAILAEAAAIGILGGIVGVAGGMLGARAALHGVRRTVSAVLQGSPVTEIEFPAWLVLLGLATGAFVALAAAVLPLREALRTPPIQGLRRERPERLSRKSWAWAVGIIVTLLAAAAALIQAPPVFGVPIPALCSALAILCVVLVAASPSLDVLARARPFLLRFGTARFETTLRVAIASISAARRRAAWACGAVGMAVALAVAITTMVGSFRQTVEDYLHQTIRSDLWVRPPTGKTGGFLGRLDPKIVDIALELFGPNVVDPFHETSIHFRGEPISLCAGEYRVVRRAAGMPFRDGSDPKDVFDRAIANGEVIVNEPFANRFGVKEGDLLRLDLPGGVLEKRVAGVFLDYSRSQGMVVIDRPEYLQRFPNDGPHDMALFLEPGADAEKARGLLYSRLREFEVIILSNRQLRGEAMHVFDETFAITKALQMVSSVVAVIAILTVLTALVDERRLDVALLRALGASRGEVCGVVLWQSGILGLWSAAAGLVFGLAVGWILVHVVNLQSFGWSMRLLPPWPAIAGIAAAVVPACFLAGAVPAWQAARRSPGELLREDE